ncbi:MAG: tyrosine-type recombinase/integrase [Campylobacteraceae bacterium]
MALNDILKKIDIKGIDCTGLYIKDIDNLFLGDTLSKIDIKKFDNQPIAIIVKFWYKNKTIKKTLNFHDITALNAVKKAIVSRIELKNELVEFGQLKTKQFTVLNELWQDYLELKKEALSKRNIYSMQKTYEKWIMNDIGNLAVDKVHTSDIQNIVNFVLRRGYKPRTSLSIKQILRPLFNYAIDINLTQVNPAIKVIIPSFDNTVDFQLSDENRIKLYQAIQNYEYDKYKGIMLFLYFGRRLNEVLTLKWENIKFEQNSYIIEDQYSKIRRRQEYPLIKPLEVFLNDFGVQSSGFVFKGETTLHVSKHTFRNHWKKLLKIVGISKMRIHDTRHLLGNTMVNQGESLESIGKVLGHSSISITKRYAKTSLETADNVLKKYLG